MTAAQASIESQVNYARKKSRLYVGVDNGVSGSLGLIYADGSCPRLIPMPTFSELGYQKSKSKHVTRIDWRRLRQLLKKASEATPCKNLLTMKVVIERPMVNPGRFAATCSAVRALEALLIVLESLGKGDDAVGREYTDSRAWQKMLLPAGIKGAADLKAASRDIGLRMWPELGDAIKKVKDCDGLLIAEWARRQQL